MKTVSYKSQIIQGFKTTGTVQLASGTLVLLLAGVLPLVGRDPGRFGIWGDLLALMLGSGILNAHADSWGRWMGRSLVFAASSAASSRS